MHKVSDFKIKEKIKLLVGKNFWETQDIKRVNLRSIVTSDGPHGLRKQDKLVDNMGFNASIKATCFPTSCTLSCSFDKELLYKVGNAIAKECKNQQVDILLGPGINIKRHPLCGRNFEYYSEDPILSGILGSSFINGIQSLNVGACVKHYCLNNQEERRLISNSVVDINTLHNLYLKPFKIVINYSNPTALMSSYNLINGVYASENSYLLNDVLKDELNYQGLIISDWGAVSSELDSFLNGLNLEMPGVDKSRVKYLYKKYKKKELPLDIIDKRITPLINFINTHEKEYLKVDYKMHNNLAREVANECSVLIKNDFFLPLKKEEKILIVGDFAFNIRYQGGGSSNVCPTFLNQIIDITNNYSSNITCIKGYDNETNELIESDVSYLKENIDKFDKVIYLCGLPLAYESEGFDRHHFNMPSSQIKLYNLIYTLTKNIGVVLIGGSPFNTTSILNAKSILIKYLSGQCTSESILDTLYGLYNPSGRLSETWPVDIDCVGIKEYPVKEFNVLYNEGEYIGYKHHYLNNIKPQFSFGSGISYSNFEYSNFLYDKDLKKISFDITNTSNIDGKEVISLYIKAVNDEYKYISLRYFDKVKITANSKKHIEITLDDSFFLQYNEELKKEVVASYNYLVSIRKDVNTKLFEFTYNPNTTYLFKMPKTSINLEGITLKNNKKGYYDLNSTINDLNSCFLGRVLNKIINKVKVRYIKKNPTLKQVIEETLKYQPLRILTIGTNGFITYKKLKVILRILNGKKHP